MKSAGHYHTPLGQLPSVRPDPPEFAGWRDYPAGVNNCNTIRTSPGASNRLDSLGSVLFSDDTSVRIIDFENKGGEYMLQWSYKESD